MGRLSDVRERMRSFPEIVERLETLREEMEWLAGDSPHASIMQLWCTYGAHAGRYLPLSLAPILDRSLIGEGIAAGWHSAPPHVSLPEHLTDHANRFLMGQLIHMAKEYDDPGWLTDLTDVQVIGSLAAYALGSTNFGHRADLIVAAPSSRGTNVLPFQIAKDVAFLTGIRYGPVDTLAFGRQVPQIKEVRDYWEKRELLHGAVEARPDVVSNRHILLLDDICRSGTTFHECARACHRAGSSAVSVLVVSKTWAFQRLREPGSWTWRERWETADRD